MEFVQVSPIKGVGFADLSLSRQGVMVHGGCDYSGEHLYCLHKTKQRVLMLILSVCALLLCCMVHLQ